jgi:hypothetical protein
VRTRGSALRLSDSQQYFKNRAALSWRQLAGPKGAPNRPQVINLAPWPCRPPKVMKTRTGSLRRASEGLAGWPAAD